MEGQISGSQPAGVAGDQEECHDIQETEKAHRETSEQENEVKGDGKLESLTDECVKPDDGQEVRRVHDEDIGQSNTSSLKREENERGKLREQLSASVSDAQNAHVDIQISDVRSIECQQKYGESSLPSGKKCRELQGAVPDRHDVNTSDKDTNLIEQSQSTNHDEQNAHQPVESMQNTSELAAASGQNVSQDFLESAIVGGEGSESLHNISSRSHTFDHDKSVHNIALGDHTRNIITDLVKSNNKKQDQGTLIEKHVSKSQSNVQGIMVNVFITWTDSETGDVVKWSHQNCNECRGRFDDWKHHVLEKHKIDEVKHESNMDILSIDIEKRSRTVVKTEAPDDLVMSAARAHLTVSIPQLINLKPHTETTQKRGRKSQQGGINRRKKSPPEVIKPDREPDLETDSEYEEPDLEMEEHDSENEEADALDSEEEDVPNVILPNKRKRGRPRKVAKEQDDPDSSEDTDPDYQPSDQIHQKKLNKVRQKKLNKVRQKKLRPKKEVEAKIYVCSRGGGGCDMAFGKFRECKRHEREAHGDDLKCQFEGCGMIFTTDFQKAKHVVDIHDGVYECQHCELTFTNRKERITHIKTHVNFKCEKENCGKMYSTEHCLKAHQRRTHFVDKSHICTVCTKTFPCKMYLNRHMRIHKERTHPCDHCPKFFKTQAAMEKHRRRHTGEGLLVCQFCGKKLNSEASLARHERVHTGEKPYQCQHCEKRFVCQGSLQSHEQEHTGKQWICDQCGYKFKTKGALQEHERIHTGERPFKCDICGKSYIYGSSLWTHVTSRHSESKRYKCDVCGKTFARYSGLSKHKTVHTGIRNYECAYCHKMFTTSGIRRGHIKQVHLGIKRTGHQGPRPKRPKKLGDEAKRLDASQPQQQQKDWMVLSL